MAKSVGMKRPRDDVLNLGINIVYRVSLKNSEKIRPALWMGLVVVICPVRTIPCGQGMRVLRL